jgi:hypothetical protein
MQPPFRAIDCFEAHLALYQSLLKESSQDSTATLAASESPDLASVSG